MSIKYSWADRATEHSWPALWGPLTNIDILIKKIFIYSLKFERSPPFFYCDDHSQLEINTFTSTPTPPPHTHHPLFIQGQIKCCTHPSLSAREPLSVVRKVAFGIHECSLSWGSKRDNRDEQVVNAARSGTDERFRAAFQRATTNGRYINVGVTRSPRETHSRQWH